ncbi:MAG: hypothetical protein IGR80_09145 [Synechococcales cyanobacterium K44_A2020_017]|nr:hypothetical protein [Synechococcales cyanobacterium K32_A2020_035]MBF2094910.1 hypothetical protein [Synechococcales cyanobacterium K44_A2020_017]
MNDQIFKVAIATVVGVGAVVGGLYLARKFRHKVRGRIESWLHSHGLSKSKLVDVLFVCDETFKHIDKVTCKIFVETQETGKQQVFEETFSLEELDHIDPEIAAQIRKNRYVEKSIMNQIA